MEPSTALEIGVLIIQCIQIIITGFLFCNLLTPRYSFAKCVLIFYAVVFLASFLLPPVISHIYMRQIEYFCLYLIICRILYKDSWRLLAFSIIFMYILVVFVNLLGEQLIPIILPGRISYMNDETLFAGNLMFCFFYLLCVYVVILFWKRRKSEIFPRSIYLISLFPFSQLLLMNIIEYFSVEFFLHGSFDEKFVFSVLAGVLVSILADMMLFWVVLENSKKERLTVQLEMMDRQSQRELAYYTSVNEKIQEIRKIRHDFNNHLQTAYNVFTNGNTEEAIQLLQHLEQNVEETAPLYYCPNPIVNAILWEKGKKAAKEGIAFQVEVNLTEKIGIEKVDLCSIFSNLLDNAIAAASRCDGERFVCAAAYIKSGYLVTKVENSFLPLYLPKERKKEETGLHGYGLLILDSIAEKYQGEFQTVGEGNRFRASIMLKMQE